MGNTISPPPAFVTGTVIGLAGLIGISGIVLLAPGSYSSDRARDALQAPSDPLL